MLCQRVIESCLKMTTSRDLKNQKVCKLASLELTHCFGKVSASKHEKTHKPIHADKEIDSFRSNKGLASVAIPGALINCEYCVCYSIMQQVFSLIMDLCAIFNMQSLCILPGSLFRDRSGCHCMYVNGLPVY